MSIPSGWSIRPLSEFILLQRGFDLPHRERVPGPYKVLSSGLASGWHNDGPVRGPGFVVGRATNIGRPIWSDENYWPLNTVLYAKNFKGNDPKFAYYWFLATDLTAFNSGSVQPMLNRNYIANVPIAVPPLNEQHGIAATLSAFDEKIESNHRASNLLIEIAMAKYRVACEKGDRVVMVDEVAQFHNRKRIPLSSQQRNDRPGPYPYYGATGVFGYVDDFLFNEILVLVGEDGSVVNDDGTPVSQYIWGKSWINNHAHPLTGRGVSTELLYLALKNVDVRPLVTGAVQPKINMGNLKRLKLRLPQDESTRWLELELQSLFASYRQLADEIKRLRDLRDTLLPELLSGRVRVTEALKVQA